MKCLIALTVLGGLVACNVDPAAKIQVEAASALPLRATTQKLNASAAGSDCLVLFIRAKVALDDSAVEALHYGTLEPQPYPGGLQQFAEEKRFRAVAYKDSNGGLWTYGSITREEAQSMTICR